MAGSESRIACGAVLALCFAMAACAPSRGQVGPVIVSEEEAIRQQIIPCWNFDAGITDPEKYTVVIRIALQPDGRVTKAEIVDDPSRMSDPAYRAVAASALRAVLNPSCVPLRLPEGWHSETLDLVFDLEKAINGGY